jgi:predicted transcriptional regulator
VKTVQIDDELHKRMKEFHEKSGISMKAIIELAVDWYLRHVHVGIGEEEKWNS